MIALAVGVPALALLTFFLLRKEKEAGPREQPASVSSASAESAAPESVPPRASTPKPAASPPSPSSPDSAEVSADFVEPASEEEFWTQLEMWQVTDKERALSFALAGEEWYSDIGKPAEARRAMIVTLLTDLGRMAEARARTRDFLEKYPNSSYRRLVQGVTGVHPRPGAPPGHQ